MNQNNRNNHSNIPRKKITQIYQTVSLDEFKSWIEKFLAKSKKFDEDYDSDQLFKENIEKNGISACNNLHRTTFMEIVKCTLDSILANLDALHAEIDGIDKIETKIKDYDNINQSQLLFDVFLINKAVDDELCKKHGLTLEFFIKQYYKSHKNGTTFTLLYTPHYKKNSSGKTYTNFLYPFKFVERNYNEIDGNQNFKNHVKKIHTEDGICFSEEKTHNLDRLQNNNIKIIANCFMNYPFHLKRPPYIQVMDRLKNPLQNSQS